MKKVSKNEHIPKIKFKNSKLQHWKTIQCTVKTRKHFKQIFGTTIRPAKQKSEAKNNWGNSNKTRTSKVGAISKAHKA